MSPSDKNASSYYNRLNSCGIVCARKPAFFLLANEVVVVGGGDLWMYIEVQLYSGLRGKKDPETSLPCHLSHPLLNEFMVSITNFKSLASVIQA